MQKNFLLAALLAASAAALPLNINLGAYSPALVVGDGEISFGGKADVTNLMNALEGAAVNGAAANGQAGTATPAAAQPAAAQPAAAQPAAAQPAVGQQPAAEGQATQIASLQGMGKEIAPRVVKLSSRDVKARDLSGFNAALKYATDAIKITPQIDLGTEASGVGILQRPGITAAQTPGTGTAKPAKAKRDENAAPKMKTTVTTMFVRGGPAPAVSKERAVAGAAVSKREPSSGIDGVNLNMAEGQVAELTFVETRAVDDDEDEDEE